MGRAWRDDDDKGHVIPRSDGEQCSTTKVVKTQCKTEEVEPDKFIKKCHKTEELLRDCLGLPVEVVESNEEYTEDDVTDQVVKGSASFGSSHNEAFTLPGLRSDIDEIGRNFWGGGLSRFFEFVYNLSSARSCSGSEEIDLSGLARDI